ncbi:DUF5067 domain-containing protein [Microbacterium sp. Sa4CUA7]|uniref:DUF5067 domain-containing protein n=1 Tax=Microbacterium pullorum TaxID=2762236 RepID=A0ABR8S4E2_9MICO|nr:DUF5067 domain-containing protein [Microbacterium pullorum]MBD7958356.1 DUF5067 domain-containing protein [Microbacterium pullorum]
MGQNGCMRKLLFPAAPVAIAAALVLTGCSPAATTVEPEPSSVTEVEVAAPAEDAAAAEESFVDGVLTTEEVKIAITDYRVIPVGEAGNEYGDKPVLAIWYDTTNLGTSDRDITPSEFIFSFEAYQDTDPNRENTLDVGMLPDPSFRDSQMENIKPGGTVPNAIAYELDDTTTPVDLVAVRLFGDDIGRMTFNLS